MPKINIKVEINSSNTISFKCNALLSNNKLKYIEPNNIKVIYDYKTKHLYRENNEFIMEYFFKEEKAYYKLKEDNKTLNLKLKTKKIKTNKNNIEIEFNIEDGVFIYRIEEIK